MHVRFISKSDFALAVLFTIIIAIVSSVQMVHADPVSPLAIDVLGSSSRQYDSSSSTFVEAQGGNITNINIDAISVTKSWQGYYGNITGSIKLDDADNNSFYVWNNATSLSGEVYASRNSTVQWSNVHCLNGSERTSEETYLGQFYTDGDSITNTYNNTLHPSFKTGSVNITTNTCLSTNVNVNGTSQSSEFYQILLSDGANNTIYTTLLESKKYAYNGKLADFQLMVGENEHAGNAGPTSYYFFTELN